MTRAVESKLDCEKLLLHRQALMATTSANNLIRFITLPPNRLMGIKHDPDEPEPNRKKLFVSGFAESSGLKINDVNPGDSANPDTTKSLYFFAKISLVAK
jgi:hypothetical protein